MRVILTYAGITQLNEEARKYGARAQHALRIFGIFLQIA
jgi:hypothetical protein